MSIPADMMLTSGARLVLVPTTIPLPTERGIWAPEELCQQILDPAESPLVTPMAVLRQDIDHFISGGLITVGHGREKTCRIKLLDPPSDEIWEIRSRGVKPGARLLGRFAAPDQFVATNMADRDSLDFELEIRRCKAEWRKLFPAHEPFSGVKPSDYITRNMVDLRALG